MSYPKFYDDVKTIKTYDPIADILGAFEDGLIKFRYIQVVKAAGHSCPTVAGAYLMTMKALDKLYGDELPLRGGVEVHFKESIDEGVAGVIGNIIAQITGATLKSGFKGLNGKFARDNLMFFNSNIESSARFTRLDSKQSVDVYYNPNVIKVNPKINELMPKVLSNKASLDEKIEFGELWQARVKRILIDELENKELIRVESV